MAISGDGYMFMDDISIEVKNKATEHSKLKGGHSKVRFLQSPANIQVMIQR